MPCESVPCYWKNHRCFVMASRLGYQRFHVKSFQSSIFESTICPAAASKGSKGGTEFQMVKLSKLNFTNSLEYQDFLETYIVPFKVVATTLGTWNSILTVYSIYMIWHFETTLANPLPGVFVCIYIYTHVQMYMYTYIYRLFYLHIYIHITVNI